MLRELTKSRQEEKESAMDSNYWTKTLRQRVARRRVIIGGSAAAMGAAFLAACGGDDDDASPTATSSAGSTGSTGSTGGSTGSTGSRRATGASTGSTGSTGADTSGLLTKAADTTSSAKPSGTWPHYTIREVRTMDPLNNASVGSGINFQALAYSRLFQWKPGILENPVGGAFVPDAAESFEVAPDGLTITFKLRQDMKFDPRPPTNGRAVTTEDVEFSWNRLLNNGLTRYDYANELSPAGPIKTIKAIDDTTVVCEMAFPIANMASRFAFHRFLSILPKEADSEFDSQNDQRGSGPWRLEKWEPSVGYTYVKNTDWHMRPGQPFFDKLEMPLITETAQLRAQLAAGAIWTVNTAANELPSTDVLAAKNDTPELGLYDDGYPWGGPNHLAFGFAAGTPFLDERVRRAMSMVIDRDLWIQANYNVDLYESAGLPMETRWNSHYSADDKTYWLDPEGSDLGEGAQYFKLNLDEAKKLMQAAGYDSPLKMPGQMANNGNDQIASLHGMLQESGLFDVSLVSLQTGDYASTVWNGMGDFEGIAMAQNMGVRGDIDQYLSTRWSPGGASGTQSMFPEVYPWYQKAQDLLTAQRQELDETKRLGILKDLQKELALQMPTVPYPGAANGFSVAWPRLANYGVFRAVYDFESIQWTRYWEDTSKA